MTASRLPALVLLNAYPLDKEQWEGLLEGLDRTNAPVGDIITFDPPGIGDMPPTQEDASLDLIAHAAVMAMREVTGRRDALWVGCSMGGYVAMAVAQHYPDAVAGLGLLGTRANADADDVRSGRERTAVEVEQRDGLADPTATIHGQLGSRAQADAHLVERLEGIAARQRGVGLAWAQRAMAARPQRLSVLEQLDVPAFVARGDEDALTTRDQAEQMAKALGVEVVQVPQVGHLVAVEAPDVVARLIATLAQAAR